MNTTLIVAGSGLALLILDRILLSENLFYFFAGCVLVFVGIVAATEWGRRLLTERH